MATTLGQVVTSLVIGGHRAGEWSPPRWRLVAAVLGNGGHHAGEWWPPRWGTALGVAATLKLVAIALALGTGGHHAGDWWPAR